MTFGENPQERVVRRAMGSPKKMLASASDFQCIFVNSHGVTITS